MSQELDALGAGNSKDLLAKHGLRPKTSIGQHFVTDPNTVRKIVGAADPDAGLVIEVGPGLGTLTRALANRKPVVAIELDRALAPVLEETVGDLANVEVVYGDVMDVDLVQICESRARGKSVALVANLPYQVSVPLVLGVLESVPQITSITVMVQKEVGERLVAEAGSEGYGGVSVKVAMLAEGGIAFKVSKRVFLPVPDVESVVVHLVRRASPSVDVVREDLWRVIDTGFAQRRKTIRRALRSGPWSPEVIEQALAAAGIDGSTRSERIDLQGFARLTKELG